MFLLPLFASAVVNQMVRNFADLLKGLLSPVCSRFSSKKPCNQPSGEFMLTICEHQIPTCKDVLFSVLKKGQYSEICMEHMELYLRLLKKKYNY